MENKLYLMEWLPAITTLVAVVGGPLISLRIAKKQINASVISANRQAWIDCLRSDICECSSLYLKIKVVYDTAHDDMKANVLESVDFYKIEEIHARIVLRLNPKEVCHKELIKSLEDLKSLKQPMEDFLIAKRLVMKHSKVILKEEWERVKRGE